ncbi:MAG: tetratricopeptide repeat protein, partial [Acidobacteriota bacterium]
MLAAAGATLVLLLAQAWGHRFLTDDAFISFRYAENLVAGEGLVFNAGERVEGYSNFLWVLLLAGLRLLGVAPEAGSQALSLALTLALWAGVAWFAHRRQHDVWSVLPLLLLALTRSIAVWSTGGLETRLFEVLTLGAVLLLLVELEEGGSPLRVPRAVWAGLLFGLASLTRPDAPLIAGATLGTAFWIAWRRRQRRPRSPRRVVAGGLVFVAITAAHFAFRRLYYGEWLPNTYYAKIGGETWWAMGWKYLAAFLLEYAVWLWLPFLVAAVAWHRRRGTPEVPALFAAAVVPHALYVVSIGGDHFEYRPFDLYFPFAFLLIADGARELAHRLRHRGRAGRGWLTAGLTAVLAGLTLLPWQSHRQFPDERYLHGFPGLWAHLDPAARNYLDPDRALVYRLPGLRSLASLHRDLLHTLSSGFVGLRAEEHARFLTTVVPEGLALRQLVETGELDPDTRIAIDAVGAIPYFSRLPVLDRLGLTDREVARSTPRRQEFLAHDKRATLEYARRRGTDLWAVHQVHLLWNVEELELHELLAANAGPRLYYSGTSQGLLLVRLPQGVHDTRIQLPGLELRPLDAAARAALADEAIARLQSAPADDSRTRHQLARLLDLRGRSREALAAFQQLLSVDPADPGALRAAARLAARAGDPTAAARLYERLIELGWGDANVYNNLGNVRVLEGRPEAAISLYRQALSLDPSRVESRLNLASVLRRAGRPQEATEQVRAVLRVAPNHPDANLRLAEDHLAQGRPLAALGYFADA